MQGVLENRESERLFTQLKSHNIFIDFTGITYIELHDISRSENGGSILLKIDTTTINLGTHTNTTHDNFEVMEELFPKPSLNAYMTDIETKITTINESLSHLSDMAITSTHIHSEISWFLVFSSPHFRASH